MTGRACQPSRAQGGGDMIPDNQKGGRDAVNVPASAASKYKSRPLISDTVHNTGKQVNP